MEEQDLKTIVELIDGPEFAIGDYFAIRGKEQDQKVCIKLSFIDYKNIQLETFTYDDQGKTQLIDKSEIPVSNVETDLSQKVNELDTIDKIQLIQKDNVLTIVDNVDNMDNTIKTEKNETESFLSQF